MVQAHPPSPCRKICKIKDKICIGCFRTRHEIKMWRDYSREEKLQVLELLETRKK